MPLPASWGSTSPQHGVKGPFSALPRPRGVRAEPPPAGKGSWGCEPPAPVPGAQRNPPQCPRPAGLLQGVRHKRGPRLQPAQLALRDAAACPHWAAVLPPASLGTADGAGRCWEQGWPQGRFCRETHCSGSFPPSKCHTRWPQGAWPHPCPASGAPTCKLGSPGLLGPPACPCPSVMPATCRPAVPSLLGHCTIQMATAHSNLRGLYSATYRNRLEPAARLRCSDLLHLGDEVITDPGQLLVLLHLLFHSLLQ